METRSLDPDQWRHRTEEVRSISENLRDSMERRILLRLAGDRNGK
jgi:hypothetical protein